MKRFLIIFGILFAFLGTQMIAEEAEATPAATPQKITKKPLVKKQPGPTRKAEKETQTKRKGLASAKKAGGAISKKDYDDLDEDCSKITNPEEKKECIELNEDLKICDENPSECDALDEELHDEDESLAGDESDEVEEHHEEEHSMEESH